MTRYALTGTPGTGKTTISKVLNKKILHLSELYSESSEEKTTSDEWLVDVEKLNQVFHKKKGDNFIVEGHLSHTLKDVEKVIVLRCDPNVLKSRMEKRNYSESKIRENLEAEAIGIIYSEAIEMFDRSNVAQLDTTNYTSEQAAGILEQFFEGKVKLDETIDYSERIMGWY
jgi:adenylate kinase